MPTETEAAEAQAAEYGTYVATEPIDIGGARAFNTGDPVPAGHVDREVVPKSAVAKVTTQAGKAAVEALSTTPAPSADDKQES